MKRQPWLAALLLAALAVPSFAEKAGESLWDFGAGVGMPLTGLDLARFGGGRERPGARGVTLSPQYLRQWTPRFGLGLELSYMDFPSRTIDLGGAPTAASADLLTFEAVGRYLFDAQSRWSPYLTAGVGVGRFAATVKQGASAILDDSNTGLALSPGVGLKADAGKRAEVMAELRWRVGVAGRDQFGTGLYNAVAVLLRLGWRR